MKNVVMMGMLLLGTAAFGQKTEIRKEVNVEEKNGVKTVTVATTTNGKTSTETYTGAEAETKIAEMEKEAAVKENGTVKAKEVRVQKEEVKTNSKGEVKNEITKKVKVENTEKGEVVTITTISNGVKTVEVYEGKEAQEKLKELEKEEPNSSKKVEKKETVIKKK